MVRPQLGMYMSTEFHGKAAQFIPIWTVINMRIILLKITQQLLIKGWEAQQELACRSSNKPPQSKRLRVEDY